MPAQSTTGKERRERDREYKREYMRAWRANPRNRTREQVNRCRWAWARKFHQAKRRIRRYTSLRDTPVCGFCGQRPPVEQVTRLKILTNGEYKSVTVPYCGQC
jgi:hypothetical protein